MIIRNLKVNCKVTSRFAHCVITSQVVNSADEAKEVAFDVEIPKTAFISDFAMCVPCLTPTLRAVPSLGPAQAHDSEGPDSADHLLISQRATGQLQLQGEEQAL